MDVKEFGKLCGSLKALTGPQPKELPLALKSPDTRMRALGAIETRREGPGACPHWGQERTIRWGSTRSGVQRMRCVACRRTFFSTTGTAVSGIHSRAGFHQVILDMFSDRPRSCRRLGEAPGFDRMTIGRRRRKIIRVLGGSGTSEPGGLVEADGTFFRESGKGSRERVRHRRDPIHHPKPDGMRRADRERTRTPMPAGISKSPSPRGLLHLLSLPRSEGSLRDRFRSPVLTMADRADARRVRTCRH